MTPIDCKSFGLCHYEGLTSPEAKIVVRHRSPNNAYQKIGLRDCLIGVTDTPAKNVLSCMVEAIKKHTVGRLYPHDDITIVTVHRKA